MRIRILDLDGSVAGQSRLIAESRAEVVPLADWGPRIRMACRFGRFRHFEEALRRHLDGSPEPALTFYGSGDFHHVSLALLRRVATPFNLLILDKHPDWMRGIPFMHCGTWVRHALRLPMLHRVFHVGGDLDFDNAWRWLAPVDEVRRGRITVFPAVRRYTRGFWQHIHHEPVRPDATPVMRESVERLLRPFARELASRPLYISLDKDVMIAEDAVVNWDSGHLRLAEVGAIVEEFISAAGGDVIGMDVIGDWSPVRVSGMLRRVLHWTEHPALAVDPREATRINERTNRTLLYVACGLACERQAAGGAH